MAPLLPIDWAELWRAQVAAEHAQYEELCPPEARPGPDWWAGLAARFRERSRQMPQPDVFLTQVLPFVRPGARVLDVGAGTGRYAVPLAQAGAQVTAVEPSDGMRAYLERDAHDQSLPIEIVSASWEEAEVAPADIVLCSHVLYPIADAEAFLRKLDRHTLRTCFIFLGYRPPSAWLEPFWHISYGVRRLPLPGALEALALLHQLGIDAGLTPVSIERGMQFESIDQALHEVHARLCLAPNTEQDRRLREALEEHLWPHPQGGLQPPQPQHMAVLSWSRQQ